MSSLKRTIIVLTALIISLTAADVAASRRPHESRPPFPYYEQEVVVRNKRDRVRLAGTLSLPLARGPFPAVVLCTGSGPHDRNQHAFGHEPFRVLADHLTRLGIAVLRVDDRGVGKSAGDFSEATSADFAADALAGIEYLKTHKEIDHAKIGLLGHSEGGLIASIAAAQSKDVAFVVMMAGPGLKGDQIVLGAGGEDLDGGWLSSEVIAQIRAAQDRIVAIIIKEKDQRLAETIICQEAEVFREIAARIRAEATAPQRKVADSVAAAIENQLPLFLSPWFRFYLTYDPRTALMKLKCPVLAISGDKDVEVPAKANLQVIRDALESGGNKDYTVLMLPNLNHLFQTAETGAISEYELIEETISTVALDTVSNWILTHTK